MQWFLQVTGFGWAFALAAYARARVARGGEDTRRGRDRTTKCDSNEDDGMNPTPSSPLRAQPRGISGGRARANVTVTVSLGSSTSLLRVASAGISMDANGLARRSPSHCCSVARV